MKLGSFLFPKKVILCNFCSTEFPKVGLDHSESLECPHCGSIARERVLYYYILKEIDPSSKSILESKRLNKYTLLEFSPRNYQKRKKIYDRVLKKYVASDFDLSGHAGQVRIDLTKEKDIVKFKGTFDIIMFSHVLEHIPDYQKALKNLSLLLSKNGVILLQVPFLEAHYVPVTWDEFHGDNTKVYHRFGFDLSIVLKKYFNDVTLVLGQREFRITSKEISKQKYNQIEQLESRHIAIDEIGKDTMERSGLGSPDLCEVVILRSRKK